MVIEIQRLVMARAAVPHVDNNELGGSKLLSFFNRDVFDSENLNLRLH